MSAKSYEVVYLDPARVHFARHGDTLSMTLEEAAPPSSPENVAPSGSSFASLRTVAQPSPEADTPSLCVPPPTLQAPVLGGASVLRPPRHYRRVVLRSCFPVSATETYLSVRDASAEEQPELGVLRDWTELQEADRQAVAAELGLHYFVPRISRILQIRDELGFLYWTVETDKGKKEFVMRNNVISYAREVSPGRWLLIDVGQARYEIADLRALDPHSQKLVSRFLFL